MCIFDMIVFLNIVLYSFLFLMEEHVHVGLWQTLLSNHPCHLLLTVCWQSLGIHGMGVNPDQFQPVMIIPFSLPAMGWSWDPILDTYTKEIPITLFLEKVPSNIQGILRLTWNLALNVALLESDGWLCLNNDV